MIVLRTSENLFKLEILNYEFYNTNIVEDLNWLNLRIYVQDKLNEWTSSGAYLQTVDLVNLLNWLSKSKSKEKEDLRIDFLEHEISFELKNNNLIINLDFNFHPKGKFYDYDIDSEYKLYFNLDEINLNNDFIENLKKIIKEFPIRTNTGSSLVN